MRVSRALRSEPRVAAATRERILALAQELDYQPDPDLARLMHRVRARKETRIPAVIAVIREEVPGDGMAAPTYRLVPLGDIRARARAYGYEVEEFWLGRDDLGPETEGFAGMDHRRDQLAAAAVDLVATQLTQNERGIPQVPRQILIPPQWIEGTSVRAPDS